MSEKFNEEEKRLLDNYVTNIGGKIFAVKNLNGLAGAVYARYSRAKTGFQETLLREFVKENQLDPKKAEQLIERVLIAFGDDSVGELEGVHVSFEDISILSTKEIEDRRIGGSPIEKSTRYVFFDEKDDSGEYKYVCDPKIMASEYARPYIRLMDYIFDTYKELILPMQDFYKQRYPLEEAEYDVIGTGSKQKYFELRDEKQQKSFKITYNIDIKTKACDSLRCLLPLATKTNVGIFGNGRYYQNLISHLISSVYPEVEEIGNKLFDELSKIIPHYVKRAKAKEYNLQVDQKMKTLVEEIFFDVKIEDAWPVGLVNWELRNSENYLVTSMLYGYTSHSFDQIYRFVEKMNSELKVKIKKTYIGERKSRRDRPGRALEAGYTYTFDLFADYGTYKDLMRHRMATIIRQEFSPLHGMIIPEDIKEAGLENRIMDCYEKVVELYHNIYRDLGSVASYLTLHGCKVRWLMGFNDREAMHLLELRTGKQGHPQYRKLSQMIHKEIMKFDPWRAEIMKFVDHNDYTSARGDSEAKQRIKENELEIKYGN